MTTTTNTTLVVNNTVAEDVHRAAAVKCPKAALIRVAFYKRAKLQRQKYEEAMRASQPRRGWARCARTA